jgi:hypothetical protein
MLVPDEALDGRSRENVARAGGGRIEAGPRPEIVEAGLQTRRQTATVAANATRNFTAASAIASRPPSTMPPRLMNGWIIPS